MFKIAVSKFSLDKKIPQGSPLWPKFNSSFENVEMETTKIIGSIYSGHAITTHHKEHWRISENYLCGQHIGLDFDTEDQTSTIDALVKDKFISKYASFIHTTISHKPEAPRARVMFLLDSPIYQAKNYTLAASALLWLFGTADRQCKDAVRFFYGAPGCNVEFLGNILPVEVIKKMIQNYKDSGQAEKRQAERKAYAAPATQQEAADALKMIPPWQIDYDEWVQVLMGIHSEFGDGGYSLAESWADGKQGEVEQKWRSFKSVGNVQGAITIATVFGIAKRFGWRKHVDFTAG